MADDTPILKLPPMAAGQRYGRLVAVERTGRTNDRKAIWRFECDCGKEVAAIARNVRKGGTSSCGCLRSELLSQKNRDNAPHGMTGTREHRTWLSMLQRCRDANHQHYDKYGGRGVTVCDRWQTFENFYADMGPRPEGMTLDRYPNKDGNYESGNCRWATAKQQNRNRSFSRMVEYQGETMSLAEACERAGAPYQRTRDRVADGWTLERALLP